MAAMNVDRALFLSGSLGKGHDVVAEACASALQELGVETRTLDCMALLGKGGSASGSWVFRRLLAVTPIYDAFHFSQLRDDGPIARAAERSGVKTMYPAFAAEFDRFDAQLIIPVFATGAGAAARLKAERQAAGRPVPLSVVVMTDSFAHRIWVHEETDLFLVTSPAAAASVRRYFPEAAVEVITAPIRPEFYRAPSQEDARANLGIPEDARCVLLMSGAWGLGPLDEAAEALAKAGYWVMAVAGTNEPLALKLREVAQRRPTVIPFGYSNRVPELMSACDVVVTSSGDTCREARTLGRGIILLDVVPGHGRENLIHELELGGSAVCAPTADSITRSVRVFLDNGGLGYQAAPRQAAGIAEAEFIAALRKLGVTFPK